MTRKCLVILLDGLGDRAYEALGDQTPLQAAHTPHLDRIAEISGVGLYHPASVGLALPSENAHFSMFGYPMDDFPGRGYLEALGAGVPLDEGAVAILAHFACVEPSAEGTRLVQGKPDISEKERQLFIGAIRTFEADGVAVQFHPTGGIRGIVTLSGDVAPFFTDTDPFIDGRLLSDIKPWRDYAHQDGVIRAAAALKAYLVHAHRVLKDHPLNQARAANGQLKINGIVTQRAGQKKTIPSFYDAYGLKGLLMASGLIYWGLGDYLGMDIAKVSDTDDCGADLAKRIGAAGEALMDYDFVHVHTKAPDEAGHTKDPMRKKSVIESLDRGIGEAIQPILQDPNIVTVVTADHSTPSSGSLIHSGEWVPIMIHGTGVRRDKVSRFNEISVSKGALGQLRGREFIYSILNHLDRSKLQGMMDTPDSHPYWPGHYKALNLDAS